MSIAASVPRAPRFALEVPVRLRRVGADSWEPGHAVNISRSGLLVAGAVSFACGDLVEAIVRLSDAVDSVADVTLRGRVTRVVQAGSGVQVATTIEEYRLQADVSWSSAAQAMALEDRRRFPSSHCD